MTEATVVQTETQPAVGLYAKLARVMGKLERLPKNGWNEHFSYAFATDADVADAIRPLLADEGIAVLVSSKEPKFEAQTTLLPVVIRLVDSETGQSETFEWTGQAMDRQDKGINKAATAAIKYWLLKTFLLSTGDPADDADAAATSMPDFLKDPESVTKVYWWLFHELSLTPEQVVEILGGIHPLQWRGGDKRVFKAVIEARGAVTE